jgi:hypothetical protein
MFSPRRDVKYFLSLGQAHFCKIIRCRAADLCAGGVSAAPLANPGRPRHTTGTFSRPRSQRCFAKEKAMWHRFALTACLLVMAPLARAQEGPERLLSAGTQLYLRWDGVEGHRAAFEKSALGKTLRGELGQFLVGFLHYTRDQLIPLAAERVDAQTLQKIGEHAGAFLEVLGKHGFALGVEVGKGAPVRAQATIVFPKAGAVPGPFVALVDRLTALGNAEVQTVKVGSRTVQHLDGQAVHALWWNEGDDAVLVLGTEPPASALKRMFGKEPRLTSHPLYQQLKGFNEFPTWGRGYVDTAALAKLAREFHPEAGQLVDDLGLAGLKSITFHSGFDGPAERGVLELNMPGERKGLLRFFNRKGFKLADLPPLPADLSSFSASNLDLAVTYDVLVDAAEGVARVVDPNATGIVHGVLKTFEDFVGVKIREDLLGSLGDRCIQYDSPADGPLAFGQVTLLKVKDADKLGKALEALARAVPNVPGLNFEVKARTYHGVQTHEIHLGVQGFFYTPTYAINKGWLAISYFPQPVQAFLLRQKGELPAWKPGPDVKKTLDKLPAEFVGVSVADPRPRLQLLLSLLPAGASLLNSFVPQAQFDVGMIPHAHAVTRYLFPNVTVTTDDGKKVRTDSRASLALPF